MEKRSSASKQIKKYSLIVGLLVFMASFLLEFNMAVTNTDDHLRNHAFILTDKSCLQSDEDKWKS